LFRFLGMYWKRKRGQRKRGQETGSETETETGSGTIYQAPFILKRKRGQAPFIRHHLFCITRVLSFSGDLHH